MTRAALPAVPRPLADSSSFVTHYPLRSGSANTRPPKVADIERLLEEWFGLPVVLLSSGRAGLALALQAKGFARYTHKLQVPAYLSRCVLNAVTTAAFPVMPPAAADGVLLYHQYGFPQTRSPESTFIIEDIAHAFFATPESGARAWTGEVALFSLKKFFSIAGMAGGLVFKDARLASRVRELMQALPRADGCVREWIRNVIRPVHTSEPGTTDTLFLESAYELLLQTHDCDGHDLVGFPGSMQELRAIGVKRLERFTIFRSFFSSQAGPASFFREGETLLPFAVPYFGSGNLESLRRANQALRDAGIYAGVYHVDVRRDQGSPKYCPCLLLPCHQDIAADAFADICARVRRHDLT